MFYPKILIFTAILSVSICPPVWAQCETGAHEAAKPFSENAAKAEQGETSEVIEKNYRKKEPKKSGKPAPIDKYAIYPMEKSDWAETYQKWGDKWMKRLNSMQHDVAKKVSYSPECDKVDIVGLDTFNSVPKKKAVFFADCANGKRFFIADSDLVSDEPAISLQSKNSRIKDHEAYSICERKIKSGLNFPESYKTSITSKSIYRSKFGNIATTIDFSAKNAFGILSSYRARCVFDETGIVEPEISEKK